MDELKKGLKIALRGAPARQALASFLMQIKAWRVALPPVKPLVLDFGLGTFDRTGLIEYWIANEAKAGYCGKYLFVFDGQTCPEHRHRVKHETFFVIKGKVRMRCGTSTRLMKEGDVLSVATGRKHSFTGIGPALLLEISMPCEVADNYFTNRTIPIGGNREVSR
ncbi:MAG: cupin domain-containing protein [Kiritimatiellia bacterium]